jgi:enolase
MIELYRTWLDEYPIVSIEDGLSEDDWTGWAKLTRHTRRPLSVTSMTRARMNRCPGLIAVP